MKEIWKSKEGTNLKDKDEKADVERDNDNEGQNERKTEVKLYDLFSLFSKMKKNSLRVENGAFSRPEATTNKLVHSPLLQTSRCYLSNDEHNSLEHLGKHFRFMINGRTIFLLML